MADLKDNNKKTSKQIVYRDKCRPWHKTPVSFEHCRVDGKRAIKYFINGKYVDTKLRKDKNNKNYFTFYPYGGQEVPSAQNQREECLMTIVSRLFKKLGYDVFIEQPLEEFSPDLLIQKNDIRVYIELKAYFETTICGDPEIAQTMKYYEKAQRIHQLDVLSMETSPNIKAALITTGKLIHFNQSVFSKENIDNEKHVENFYKNIITTARQAKSLDALSARSIYKQALKKYKRNVKIGFNPMNIKYITKKNMQNVKEILLQPNEFNIIIFPPDRFMEFLLKEGLKEEARKFELIRTTTLEGQLIDRHLLEF